MSYGEDMKILGPCGPWAGYMSPHDCYEATHEATGFPGFGYEIDETIGGLIRGDDVDAIWAVMGAIRKAGYDG